jgi:hypothetical protein
MSLKDYYYSEGDIKIVDGEHENSKNIVLDSEDDLVAYPIYINEESNYNFDLTFKKEHQGRKIKVRIDDGDYIIATLPDVENTDLDYIKTTIFNEILTEGYHTLLIRFIEELELSELSFTPTSKDIIDDEFALDSREEIEYITKWEIEETGHISKGNERNIAYLPFDNLTNVELEVDISILVDSTVTSAACGLIMRAKNAGLYTTEDQTGIQSYFCGINSFSVFISKYNFEYSELGVASERSRQKPGVTYHLKATLKESKIILDFNNGEILLEYNDPYKMSAGKVGFYADDITASFSNLKIKTI